MTNFKDRRKYIGWGHATGAGGDKNKWEMVDCPYPVQEDPKCCTFAYSEMTEHWIGALAYSYDKYLMMDDTTIYGMRDGETFLLNEGDKIQGQDIIAEVLTAASPNQVKDKEFLRIRINSDNKPSSVKFYVSMDEVIDDTHQAILDVDANPLALKDYNGFEQYVPRRVDNGNRFQGRVMLYKIKHSKEGEEFVLVDTEIQYKGLK